MSLVVRYEIKHVRNQNLSKLMSNTNLKEMFAMTVLVKKQVWFYLGELKQLLLSEKKTIDEALRPQGLDDTF